MRPSHVIKRKTAACQCTFGKVPSQQCVDSCLTRQVGAIASPSRHIKLIIIGVQRDFLKQKRTWGVQRPSDTSPSTHYYWSLIVAASVPHLVAAVTHKPVKMAFVVVSTLFGGSVSQTSIKRKRKVYSQLELKVACWISEGGWARKNFQLQARCYQQKS